MSIQFQFTTYFELKCETVEILEILNETKLLRTWITNASVVKNTVELLKVQTVSMRIENAATINKYNRI